MSGITVRQRPQATCSTSFPAARTHFILYRVPAARTDCSMSNIQYVLDYSQTRLQTLLHAHTAASTAFTFCTIISGSYCVVSPAQSLLLSQSCTHTHTHIHTNTCTQDTACDWHSLPVPRHACRLCPDCVCTFLSHKVGLVMLISIADAERYTYAPLWLPI